MPLSDSASAVVDVTLSPPGNGSSVSRDNASLRAVLLAFAAVFAAASVTTSVSAKHLWTMPSTTAPVVGTVSQAAQPFVGSLPRPTRASTALPSEDPLGLGIADNSQEELPEADLEPKGWTTSLLNVGSAACLTAASLVAYIMGRKEKHQQETEQAHLQAGLTAKRSWSLAAASGDRASQEDGTKFIVGLAWFFAHQLIGVGNDVIMKFVGGNLAVAQIVFLRFAFATLTMLPFMFASGSDSFQTNRLPLHIARSVLLAGGIGLYCTGLTIAPIAVVTTLNFTIPLFTLVLSRLFLKEQVGGLRWFATLAGFLGVMVVLQPAQMAFNPQWLVVLCGAAMFASLDVLNKFFVGKESFWAMIFYTALFTAGLSAYPASQVWMPVTGNQLRLLALLGGGANMLLYCLLKSFSLVDASALAPFRYTELLLSALVGFLFFAEVPALTTLLGAAVIIPSTLFVVWQESKAKSQDNDGRLGTASA